MNNQTINEINNRDLDKVLFSLTIISQDVFFDYGNEHIDKRTIFTLIGCNINGIRRYITSFFEDELPNTSDWYDMLLSLKSRGLNHIFFAVIPNTNTIKYAFELAFKGITCFFSCFNLFNRLFHFIPCSYTDNILNAFRSVYLSDNIDEFNLRKNEILSSYSHLPFIVDILSKEFDSFYPFLDFSPFIRKHVFSFYFFRDISKRLRFISNNYSITSISDFESQLIPFIQKFESRMYCPKVEWSSIVAFLYQQDSYKDLLLCSF